MAIAVSIRVGSASNRNSSPPVAPSRRLTVSLASFAPALGVVALGVLVLGVLVLDPAALGPAALDAARSGAWLPLEWQTLQVAFQHL